MKTYKITRNGESLKGCLTEKEAQDMFFVYIEDYSDGYIYDEDNNTIYAEIDHRTVAVAGDDFVRAGDYVFEIEEEDFEC